MNQAATALETADIVAILKALPHRYPFLMVDRIINMRGDESAIGIKNVTANEPQFLGHFPGNPVFPGVLLIEGMAQTAGAMLVVLAGRGVLVHPLPQRRHVAKKLAAAQGRIAEPLFPRWYVGYHAALRADNGTFADPHVVGKPDLPGQNDVVLDDDAAGDAAL